jgi:hypothetical protein
MLEITYQCLQLNGAFSPDPDPAAVDFHDAAASQGLDIVSTPDGKTLRVTGDSRALAAFYRDIAASGIDATVSTDAADADEEDIFRASLGDLATHLTVRTET